MLKRTEDWGSVQWLVPNSSYCEQSWNNDFRLRLSIHSTLLSERRNRSPQFQCSFAWSYTRSSALYYWTIPGIYSCVHFSIAWLNPKLSTLMLFLPRISLSVALLNLVLNAQCSVLTEYGVIFAGWYPTSVALSIYLVGEGDRLLTKILWGLVLNESCKDLDSSHCKRWKLYDMKET